MANVKMKDALIQPIADYDIRLSEVLHQADIVTFQMQAAAQFEHSPEIAAQWKRKAKKRMAELRKAVKVLGDGVAAL